MLADGSPCPAPGPSATGSRSLPCKEVVTPACDRTEGRLEEPMVSGSQGIVEASRGPRKRGTTLGSSAKTEGVFCNSLSLRPWSHHESLAELMFIDAVFC